MTIAQCEAERSGASERPPVFKEGGRKGRKEMMSEGEGATRIASAGGTREVNWRGRSHSAPGARQGAQEGSGTAGAARDETRPCNVVRSVVENGSRSRALPAFLARVRSRALHRFRQLLAGDRERNVRAAVRGPRNLPTCIRSEPPKRVASEIGEGEGSLLLRDKLEARRVKSFPGSVRRPTRTAMRTVVFCWTLLLISASIAGSVNDCEDPNFHSLETLESSKLECGPAFKNRCRCLRTCYDGHHQYVVNCTDTGFHDTSPLAHLPNETQVLIFTGNELEELPWNVFGSLDSLPYLKVIDMSNNKIREIRGKAYHHVQHVERLILDFNELSLDPARSHPRVFSNFISLLELHLTDAFEDGPPRNLASTLHDIFVNSNLTQLIKLHLEQNEISEFRDANVFCDLPNLLDLHLGDNDLNALHFNLSCLRNLRFLDLRRNKFTRVLERDLHTMDNLAKHERSVAVDFSGNPFECSCKLNPFIKWMKKTKVFIRNKASLQCYQGNVSHNFHETKNCAPKLLTSTRRGTTVVLCFLSMVLIALVCALVYLQRAKLQKKIEPVLDSVSKRVRYTSIANGDTREDV